MTEEFNSSSENEVNEEPTESGSGWRNYVLPSLVLAVLVVVVVVGYVFVSSFSDIGFLSASRPVRIAFMSNRDGNWEIYIMDRDGNNQLNLTNSPARDGIPIHASGQDSLVFASDQDGPLLDVFLISLDGSNIANITQTPNSNEIPITWSPDGDRVVFAGDQSGASEIYLIETSGAEQLNLTEREAAQSFDDWSASADQFILTSASDAMPSLLITDLAGSTHQALTDGSYPAAGGQWSPDGQQITYMAIGPESTTIDIFVADVAGGEAVNITQSPSNDRFPRWSPDGSKIAFVSDRDGNSEIYVVDADGSNPTNLTNSLADESVQGDFSWSPDGTQILFHTNRDNNVEVYVMDADGSNQVNVSNSPGDDYFAVWVE